MSARGMSDILGFGVNQYRLYEGGEVPTVPHGKPVRSVDDPAVFAQHLATAVGLPGAPIGTRGVPCATMFALGTGTYTPPDAARLLGEPVTRLRGWAQRYFEQDGFGQLGGEPTIDFLTLIELKTFSRLRAAGVTTRKIVKAAEQLERLTGQRHPFAQRTILSKMATDGACVYWEINGSLVSLDGKRQFALEVIREFVQELSFASEGTASSFKPSAGKGSIELNPKRRFGQPVIVGTNIEAEVLCRMHEAGDSIRLIAREYDLTLRRVRDAIEFCMAA